jgi:hypothetical protein
MVVESKIISNRLALNMAVSSNSKKKFNLCAILITFILWGHEVVSLVFKGWVFLAFAKFSSRHGRVAYVT